MHLIRSFLRLGVVCFCSTVFAASTLDNEREISRSPKGPLPDPALLDGSAQQAEKRQDRGMLGQFDIPGDDKSDSKDGTVGPQSSPNGGGTAAPDDKNTQAGGAAASPAAQEQDKNSQGGGGGQTADAKKDGQSGGGGGGQQSASSSKTGGGGGDAQGGAGSQGGADAGGPSGGKPASQGGAMGGPQGIQVGQLLGDGQGTAQGQQGAQTGGGSNKPQQVALGDKAMQINQAPPTPGVVGAQVADPMTRPADAKMGTGAGGPGGDNTNRGSEKGRTMPKGL